MSKIVLLVGPPGSGKSTYAHNLIHSHGDNGMAVVRVSQDDQGKIGHMEVFEQALSNGQDIVVDRMGFVKVQRERYLKPARNAGYTTEIVVFHENMETCYQRVMARKGHPTIKDETSAKQALNLFFSKYERVQDEEAATVTRIWPEGEKPSAVICDLDGTLCNCEHRRHFVNPDVKPEGWKKNWKGFFAGIKDDSINHWCFDILRGMSELGHQIVYASGRDDNQRAATVEWLIKHECVEFNPTFALFMRNRQDSRHDFIVKEMILDFEILSRYKPYFMIDDRQQVVAMWRRRGFVCLQCDTGDF